MQLSEAIDQLYVAFAPHQRRETIDSCPDCVGQADQDRLACVPLRQLSSEQLGRYAFKAMSTWGGPEDYVHFLPRILELATSARGELGLDLGLIARKLQYAGWQTWRPVEQQAVRDYLAAVWSTVLQSDPLETSWRAEEVLPALGMLLADLSPHLAAWESEPGLNAALQLAGFLERHWGEVAKQGHLQGDWGTVAAREQMERWLLNPARKLALESAFERNLESPSANRLAVAIDSWQWMTS